MVRESIYNPNIWINFYHAMKKKKAVHQTGFQKHNFPTFMSTGLFFIGSFEKWKQTKGWFYICQRPWFSINEHIDPNLCSLFYAYFDQAISVKRIEKERRFAKKVCLERNWITLCLFNCFAKATIEAGLLIVGVIITS